MGDDELYSQGDEDVSPEGSSAPDEGARARGVIVDNKKLGRKIRSVRVLRDASSDDAFAAKIEKANRLVLTPRVLYNVQSGTRGPTLEEAVAIVDALNLPGGLHTLLEAYDKRIADKVRRLDAQWVDPGEED